ncbi:MAG: SDR family NAD(P)-dependent oxidoreductase, partial [Paracoccaceae bacterium]
MKLEGKSALITGGASGFGAAIARRFSAEGAQVIIMDLDGEGAAIVASECGAHSVVGDVTKAEDINRVVSVTIEQTGRADIVVNNAGWTHRNKPMLEVSEEEYDRLYDINVRSIFHMTRAIVPVMRQQGGGVIL